MRKAPTNATKVISPIITQTQATNARPITAPGTMRRASAAAPSSRQAETAPGASSSAIGIIVIPKTVLKYGAPTEIFPPPKASRNKG